MTDVAKRGVTLVVVAFAAFYPFTQPENAADAIKGALDGVTEAFDAIIRFFNALVS